MSAQKFSGKYAFWLAIVLLASVPPAPTVWADVEIPYEGLWADSGHADANAEAFTHWGTEPNVIDTRCAKCHSTPGFLDFLGADGTAAGTVENEPNVGTTITCVACHNEATIMMDSVTFPSGIEVTRLGDEARCMQCHQGRQSSNSVDDAIANANLPDDDTVSASLSFKNIHYLAAAATQFAGQVKGGYQYNGRSYDSKFAHVEGLDTCIACHEPHSLEIDVDTCIVCHTNVASRKDLKDIRFMGSTSDYDGDGNVSEGISDEIAGLQEILYSAIQAYAAGTAGVAIVYDPGSYPYFFIDNNGNGVPDPGETNYGNKYNAWTARLLRTAYNYQFSRKDPGGYAHGGKYIIQLLYDSIEDLNPALVAGLNRDDAGHFAGSEEPWRHWDDDGKVSGRCSKCHSASGLAYYIEEGVTASEPISNGLMCSTCHDAIPEFTRRSVDEVQFPSGAVLDTGDPNSNLCISCHQGRQSTVSVNEAIAGLSDDTISGKLTFKNVHYYAAGATLFGTEAKGAYEYVGRAYKGRFHHVPALDTCTECHDTHKLEVHVNYCIVCHNVVTGPRDIRRDHTDFDGDGNTTEGLVEEIETLQDALYAAIQSYAAKLCGVPIIYSTNYPYFFIDTNGNGVPDEHETSYANKYNAFTPRLLQAAYNYQFAMKDPGGFAHNGKYVIQILYDSLADLGTQVTVDMTGMVRPEGDPALQDCGDATHPYPSGDLNHDCRVTFADLAIFCAHWLQDNSP